MQIVRYLGIAVGVAVMAALAGVSIYGSTLPKPPSEKGARAAQGDDPQSR